MFAERTLKLGIDLLFLALGQGFSDRASRSTWCSSKLLVLLREAFVELVQRQFEQNIVIIKFISIHVNKTILVLL